MSEPGFISRLLRALSMGSLAVVAVLFSFGCSRQPIQLRANRSLTPAAAPAAFTDIAHSAGLNYRWSIPGKRPLNILQTIGNGCAFLDFNNDGNLDILLVGPKLALYMGDGHGHFTDVTRRTGLDRFSGQFLGCAVGDYDNDGFDDIYISGFRTGLLLHNEHGRRFSDATVSAGMRAQPWGTSCVFFDADNDGLLDLFVGNYVEFGPSVRPQLCSVRGVLTGCAPTEYRALKGVLYHNLGHGKFRDVTREWGLGTMFGRTLGAAAGVYGASHSPALALADDETPGNLFVFHGQHARDIGTQTGVARLGSEVVGGMGIDWGASGGSDLDLIIATYENQGKLLFRARGDALSVADSTAAGLGPETVYVAFGVKMFDFDNDGRLDVAFANGHVEDNIDQIGGLGPTSSFTYRQPVTLFHNVDNLRFQDVTSELADGARQSIVGRGLAVGDFDNDGRVDVLVVDAEGAPLLLRNVCKGAGHWLEFRLCGTRSNRDGLGALVTVATAHAQVSRLCTTGGSYLSASDRRVHVGLSSSTSARISVRWPSGVVREYGWVSADQTITLTE